MTPFTLSDKLILLFRNSTTYSLFLLHRYVSSSHWSLTAENKSFEMRNLSAAQKLIETYWTCWRSAEVNFLLLIFHSFCRTLSPIWLDLRSWKFSTLGTAVSWWTARWNWTSRYRIMSQKPCTVCSRTSAARRRSGSTSRSTVASWK